MVGIGPVVGSVQVTFINDLSNELFDFLDGSEV